MMRKLFVILTMLAALMLASVGLAAAPSLVDNANVLTPQQKREVLTELRRQEQEHGIRMGVVVMKTAIWCFCRLSTNANGISALTKS